MSNTTESTETSGKKGLSYEQHLYSILRLDIEQVAVNAGMSLSNFSFKANGVDCGENDSPTMELRSIGKDFSKPIIKAQMIKEGYRVIEIDESYPHRKHIIMALGKIGFQENGNGKWIKPLFSRSSFLPPEKQ